MSRLMPNALALALRGFLADHLPRVRGASPHTVRSYRDSLALLLRFLSTRLGRPVVTLDVGDVTPEDLLAFLDHLEADRGNSVTTRNARLAAVHAFARYVAARDPEHVERCQRLIAVPFKRASSRAVDYFESDELQAILDAPSRSTAYGRRDHALLLALFNTGARVQEIIDLRPCDLQLVRPFQVRLFGKGRKERRCPLWPETVEALRVLIADEPGKPETEPLFRNRRGRPLTRFGVRYLLSKYARLAQDAAPTLRDKRVHPHVMRHTTAVHLLQAGVDIVTISHWLGHANVETTNRYTKVDLEKKRDALAKARPLIDLDHNVAGWRSDATILDWLERL